MRPAILIWDWQEIILNSSHIRGLDPFPLLVNIRGTAHPAAWPVWVRADWKTLRRGFPSLFSSTCDVIASWNASRHRNAIRPTMTFVAGRSIL
jgi:hypothetical protein